MLTSKPTFSGSLASVIAQHLDKQVPRSEFAAQGWFGVKDRYRLIEDLNASEPGAAFYAEDEKLKQRVALRILHGDWRPLDGESGSCSGGKGGACEFRQGFGPGV